MKSLPENPTNILIINVSGIGDFVESAAALQSIRSSLPKSHISLLTSSRVFEYAKTCPYVDEVFEFPVTHGKGFASSISAISKILNIIKCLRKREYDTAVNLYNISSWSGALRMFALIKSLKVSYSMGRNTHGKGFFYDYKLEDDVSQKKNQAQYYNDLAEIITNNSTAISATLWRSIEDKNDIDSLFNELNIYSSDLFILINAGYDRSTRRWDPKRFAEVADHFVKNHSAKILITGSKSESHIADDIINTMTSKAHNIAGRSSISGLIELISRAKLLISTNSAAIHIAGIENTPFVCASGSSDIYRSRPSGDDNKIEMVSKKIECNPCTYIECPEKHFMKCMDMIDTVDIINAAENMINRSKGDIDG